MIVLETIIQLKIRIWIIEKAVETVASLASKLFSPLEKGLPVYADRDVRIEVV